MLICDEKGGGTKRIARYFASTNIVADIVCSKRSACTGWTDQTICIWFALSVTYITTTLQLLFSPMVRQQAEDLVAGKIQTKPKTWSLDSGIHDMEAGGEDGDGDGGAIMTKRKRKRCGKCPPCLRKENCNVCKQCLNRETGHQICKLRKCLLLKSTAAGRKNSRRSVIRKDKQTSQHGVINNRENSQPLNNKTVVVNSDTTNLKMLESKAVNMEEDNGGLYPRKEIHADCDVEVEANGDKSRPRRDSKALAAGEETNVKDSVDTFVRKDRSSSDVIFQQHDSHPLTLMQPSTARNNNQNQKEERSIEQTYHSPGVITAEFEPPQCSCNVDAPTQPPFYNHLGSAASFAELRKVLEERYEIRDNELRIEKVRYTSKEGKNLQGCPIARWVVRRSDKTEKILVIARERRGHCCRDSIIVLSIVIWDGLEEGSASNCYQKLIHTLNEHATVTVRRCASNDTKNCSCQGTGPETCGASFSFGCSWSMYYNGCKFGNSTSPRKYRLQNPEKESEVEHLLAGIATKFAPICKKFAPRAYANMVLTLLRKDSFKKAENENGDKGENSDSTNHDDNNDNHHRVVQKDNNDDNDDDDEQLHVLPMYQLLDDNNQVAEANYKMPEHTMRSKISKNSNNENLPKKQRGSKRKRQNSDILISTMMQENNMRQDQEIGLLPSFSTFEQQTSLFNGGLFNMADGFGNGNQAPAFTPQLRLKDNASVNYVDESRIPSVFSQTWHGIQNYKMKHSNHNGAKEFFPKRPRLKHVSDFKPIMMRQQLKDYDVSNNLLNGNIQESIDMRKRLGYCDLKNEKMYPFVAEEKMKASNVVGNNGITGINANHDCVDDGNDFGPVKDFITGDMGGVAIALTHGSILIECAKKEVHATTALRKPLRQRPARLSVILYQHKQLNEPNHGYDKYQQKLAARQQEKLLNEQLNNSKLLDMNGHGSLISKETPFDDLQLLAEAALSAKSTSITSSNTQVSRQHATPEPYGKTRDLSTNHSSVSFQPNQHPTNAGSVRPRFPVLSSDVFTFNQSNGSHHGLRNNGGLFHGNVYSNALINDNLTLQQDYWRRNEAFKSSFSVSSLLGLERNANGLYQQNHSKMESGTQNNNMESLTQPTNDFQMKYGPNERPASRYNNQDNHPGDRESWNVDLERESSMNEVMVNRMVEEKKYRNMGDLKSMTFDVNHNHHWSAHTNEVDQTTTNGRKMNIADVNNIEAPSIDGNGFYKNWDMPQLSQNTFNMKNLLCGRSPNSQSDSRYKQQENGIHSALPVEI
eukprot:gene12319-13590_t